MEQEEMKIKSKVNKRLTGRVASKVPEIEFDRKAIKEIKKRKKGHYERWSIQSKGEGR